MDASFLVAIGYDFPSLSLPSIVLSIVITISYNQIVTTVNFTTLNLIFLQLNYTVQCFLNIQGFNVSYLTTRGKKSDGNYTKELPTSTCNYLITVDLSTII